MIDVLRNHCLEKKYVTEGFPFDEHSLVFKVQGKIFALFSLVHKPLRINVKCQPEYAVELRNTYWQISSGYHCNKKHWNTIIVDDEIDRSLLFKWIDHSYELVWEKLPKRLKR